MIEFEEEAALALPNLLPSQPIDQIMSSEQQVDQQSQVNTNNNTGMSASM